MARDFCWRIPIATPAITWATSIASITAPKQEEQKWKIERDPIKNLATWMLEQKLTDAAQLAQIEAELTAEMDKAVEFAVAAPYPAPEEVEQDVYA